MYFLDTHIIVWLYQKSIELLSPKARRSIEENDVFISPIVILELEYLHEIGRLKVDANTIVQYLQSHIGLRVEEGNFHEVINMALEEKWTRDPFDRIIVAHSKYSDAYLVTKDERISTNYFKAIF
ncbi:MAG TPA: type II toxin-antitoxin system VapC family toxin [Candidatus Deferrimicrobium sp.]|nr:type II toxin-antitoxin system VapC family toxin [Candidatus Deferrimicrobium sp.]